MQLKTIFQLAYNNLRNKRVRTILTMFSLSIGVAVLFFFLSFAQGVESAFFSEIEKTLDPRDLIVTYDYRDAGLFQKEANASLRLDQKVLKQIGALPNVAKVSPQLALKIPVTLDVDFWDKYFETDVPVYGMDFDFLKINLPAQESGVLPVVISERLLDVYNSSLAETTGLPRLSKEGLIGRKLDLIVGKSSFFSFQTDKQKRFPAQIVGLSPLAPVMGITIPLATAQKILADFQNLKPEDLKYSAFYLKTSEAQKNSALTDTIKKMGFRVVSAQELQQQILQTFWYIQTIISILGGVIFGVALFAMINTLFMSVFERRREIGILRAIGMQRAEVSLLIWSEGVMLGLGAFVVGIILAFFATGLADFYLLKIFPEVSFKPQTFFTYDFITIGSVFGLTFLFVFLAGFFPARKASRLDPLVALLED